MSGDPVRAAWESRFARVDMVLTELVEALGFAELGGLPTDVLSAYIEAREVIKEGNPKLVRL